MQAVTAVNKLTEQCAELVEAMDAALPEPQLPLQVCHEHIIRTNTQHHPLQK